MSAQKMIKSHATLYYYLLLQKAIQNIILLHTLSIQKINRGFFYCTGKGVVKSLFYSILRRFYHCGTAGVHIEPSSDPNDEPNGNDDNGREDDNGGNAGGGLGGAHLSEAPITNGNRNYTIRNDKIVSQKIPFGKKMPHKAPKKGLAAMGAVVSRASG